MGRKERERERAGCSSGRMRWRIGVARERYAGHKVPKRARGPSQRVGHGETEEEKRETSEGEPGTPTAAEA